MARAPHRRPPAPHSPTTHCHPTNRTQPRWRPCQPFPLLAKYGAEWGGEPTGDLATAIAATFGSFSEFQAQFQQAGLKHFGSGWVWLVLTPQGNLTITTTLNQDSPLMQGHVPILGNDLWEHAYYLTYRNRRDQYLEAWWQVVNWPWLSDRYAQMRALLA